jgi:hypothetical protein
MRGIATLATFAMLTACGTIREFAFPPDMPLLSEQVEKSAHPFIWVYPRRPPRDRYGSPLTVTLNDPTVTEAGLCGRPNDATERICYKAEELSKVYIHKEVYDLEAELKRLAPLGVFLCGPLVVHCAAATQ